MFLFTKTPSKRRGTPDLTTGKEINSASMLAVKSGGRGADLPLAWAFKETKMRLGVSG